MARESAARSSMRDRAKARTESATHGGGGGMKYKLPDGIDFFKPEHSDRGMTYKLDVLPYEITDPRHPEVLAGNSKVGDLIDCRFVFTHGNIGADNKSYLCLGTWGKKCPICEEHKRMKASGNFTKEEVKALARKERVLYNVIDTEEKGQPIRFWDMSYYNFHQLLEEEQKNKEKFYAYAELDGGYTLEVRFKSKSMGSGKPFAEASRIDFEERDPYKEDILKEVVPIDDVLVELSYEELERILMQADDEPVDPDPDTKSSRGREERGSDRRGRDDKDEKEEKETRRGRREVEPEKEADTRRGRRDSEPEKEEHGGRRGRADDDDRPSRRGRDDDKEEKIHRRDPDADGERERHASEKEEKGGRHPVDPDQDCPADGKFGVDIDKHKECLECDKWDDCRDEKDRLAKEGRGKTAEKEKGGRGSEDSGRSRRGR